MGSIYNKMKGNTTKPQPNSTNPITAIIINTHPRTSIKSSFIATRIAIIVKITKLSILISSIIQNTELHNYYNTDLPESQKYANL